MKVAFVALFAGMVGCSFVQLVSAADAVTYREKVLWSFGSGTDGQYPYASLINVNAYHQPGVEAGKKAASAIIDLQRKTLQYLREKKSNASDLNNIADGIGVTHEIETVFWICEHLAANPDHRVSKTPGKSPFEAMYQSI